MKIYPYLSRLCNILIDCGLIEPVDILEIDDEYCRRVFGDKLVDSSHIIHLVCKSRTFSNGKLLYLYIDYYPYEDILAHRAYVFYKKPISDYLFRKLRKLLKDNGYI